MRGEVNVKNLVLFFNGIIIGVGKIIPGLSGSMIMMILGLYERAIDAILL
jgi:putative membrane protein